MTPQELVGQLADPDRLAVVSALALGARTTADIADRTGMNAKAVSKAAARLARAGLITDDGIGFVLHTHLFTEAARAAAPAKEHHDHPDDKTAATLRAFVEDGRLTGMPAQRTRRLVVLEHVAQSFEPGVRYQEREVSSILDRWCGAGVTDRVTLRRYLVDEGMLCRADGEYWRTGGQVV